MIKLNIVLSFNHQVCFSTNIFGKQSNLHFSRNSYRKKDKSVLSFKHEQNIINCNQTQLDGIAHEQTIICRQLFAGHVVGSRPTKKKKKLHRMIITFICKLVVWESALGRAKHDYSVSTNVTSIVIVRAA